MKSPSPEQVSTDYSGNESGHIQVRLLSRELQRRVAQLERESTERVRAEHALRASEERLRAILTTAVDAIVTIDEHGTIQDLNPATERIFGYTRDEIVGQNISLLVLSSFESDRNSFLQRYLECRDPRMISVGSRKDGTTFPADVALSELASPPLFTAIIRDVSHRMELQREILKVATDEQRRIGQDLHDHTGQELTALNLFAETLAETVCSAQRMTSENGLPCWQFEDGDFHRLQHLLMRLRQGLGALHRHLQELSRGIIPAQVDAEGLSSALTDLAEKINGQAQVQCVFESDVTLIVGNTAATHLYRIAQEALNNAIRHGKAGLIRLSLAVKDPHIVLEIEDNGQGFDHAAPAARRGMGLKIMKYRAGMCGGIVRIEPKDGGGTLVRCTIPCGAQNFA